MEQFGEQHRLPLSALDHTHIHAFAPPPCQWLMELFGAKTTHALAFMLMVCGGLYGMGFGMYWGLLLTRKTRVRSVLKPLCFLVWSAPMVVFMACLHAAPAFYYWQSSMALADHDHDGDIDSDDESR